MVFIVCAECVPYTPVVGFVVEVFVFDVFTLLINRSLVLPNISRQPVSCLRSCSEQPVFCPVQSSLSFPVGCLLFLIVVMAKGGLYFVVL